MQNNEVKGKIIRNPALVNQLLECGHQIISIKPNRDIKNASVFVFRRDEKFDRDLDRIMREYTDSKKDAKKTDFDKAVEKAVQARLDKEVSIMIDAAIADKFKNLEKCVEV